MRQEVGGEEPRTPAGIRGRIREAVSEAPPRRWLVRDFYDRLRDVNHSSIRSALEREVGAGFLHNLKHAGIYFLAEKPPLWDPLFRYENIRLWTSLEEEGSRGSRRVPLLGRLAEITGQTPDAVYNDRNHGFHFGPFPFDTLESIREPMVSVYPGKAVYVALGSAGNPLWLWEVFLFFVGWLPPVTGIPVPAWAIRQIEINRDHLLAEPLGPISVLSGPVALSREVRVLLKIYTKELGGLPAARAEARYHLAGLSGVDAKDALLDDARQQLRWPERWAGR